MKNGKQLLGLALVGMLSLALLAGCGDEKAASGDITYVVLDETLDAEEYGIGFRPDDIALGLKVAETLDEMEADGKGAEISNKWFGEDILLQDAPPLNENNTPAADDQSLQKVLDSGKFIMGLDDSFPPMGYRDENNEVVGFDIDLAKEVAERLGVELVVQPIDWDAKELELSTGKIDCIWNGMTITPERLEAMYIPRAYVANQQIVIVPSDSDIKSVADLAGKTVGLQKGSSSLNALQKNPVASEVKEIVEYPENVSAFMDLKAGRVDAFVVDEVVGRYLISNDSESAAE